jgi:hypothetical protein
MGDWGGEKLGFRDKKIQLPAASAVGIKSKKINCPQL